MPLDPTQQLRWNGADRGPLFPWEHEPRTQHTWEIVTPEGMMDRPPLDEAELQALIANVRYRANADKPLHRWYRHNRATYLHAALLTRLWHRYISAEQEPKQICGPFRLSMLEHLCSSNHSREKCLELQHLAEYLAGPGSSPEDWPNAESGSQAKAEWIWRRWKEAARVLADWIWDDENLRQHLAKIYRSELDPNPPILWREPQPGDDDDFPDNDFGNRPGPSGGAQRGQGGSGRSGGAQPGPFGRGRSAKGA